MKACKKRWPAHRNSELAEAIHQHKVGAKEQEIEVQPAALQAVAVHARLDEQGRRRKGRHRYLHVTPL